MLDLNEAACPSWYANIWIGGDYAESIQACREFCRDNP